MNGKPCGVPQTAQGSLSILAPVVQAPVVRAAPATSRRSVVTLPFEAPTQARSLVVSHRFPAGASYTPGSSRLGSQPIADPSQGASGKMAGLETDPAQRRRSRRALIGWKATPTWASQ